MNLTSLPMIGVRYFYGLRQALKSQAPPTAYSKGCYNGTALKYERFMKCV